MDKMKTVFEPAENGQNDSVAKDWSKSYGGMQMHNACMGYANYGF